MPLGRPTPSGSGQSETQQRAAFVFVYVRSHDLTMKVDVILCVLVGNLVHIKKLVFFTTEKI